MSLLNGNVANKDCYSQVVTCTNIGLGNILVINMYYLKLGGELFRQGRELFR